MSETKKLGRAVANTQPLLSFPVMKPGYVEDSPYKFDYHKVVKECRYQYERDAIAGTVINRLCEIASTPIKNRRKSKNSKNAVKDEIMAYYNVVADNLKPFIKQLALEYVLNGMVVPEFSTKRMMGNRATDKLGRTRYYFPDKVYCRDVSNIEIVKLPTGYDRVLLLKIPAEEIKLVTDKGGNDPSKKALYQYLVDNYPDYVADIRAGKTKFPLTHTQPIFRKITSYNAYPIPYLLNALDSLKHKARLKAMDMSIASRIIEAVRQIKVGNDEYPADDDDLRAEEAAFKVYGNVGEKVFNYFTNHTIEISWSYPPFEQLLNEQKYAEPNREILFALGFPRIWLNGETEKSNASDNRLAIIGPLSTIEDIRDQILIWVKWFYEQLAELNNFDRIPEPYFSAINTADVANLIQYAVEVLNAGAISKETVAELYGKTWEEEQAQREAEEAIAPELETEMPPTNPNPINNNPEGENEDPPTEQTFTQTE